MSKLLPCPFCGGEARMWPSHTKTDKNGSYEIVGCSNIDCFIEPTTDEYLPYEEAIQRWNTRSTPARCDELETVGWLWEYAQYRTDERGYYGYETVITENNPTDHVSPAEKLRNIRDLVTRQNAEKVIASERAESERLRELLKTQSDAHAKHVKGLIAQHEREREIYGQAAQDFRQRAEKAEADNNRLREALEPFADVADLDIGDDEDDRAVFWPISSERHSNAGRLRVGDLRRASKALGEGKP